MKVRCLEKLIWNIFLIAEAIRIWNFRFRFRPSLPTFLNTIRVFRAELLRPLLLCDLQRLVAVQTEQLIDPEDRAVLNN